MWSTAAGAILLTILLGSAPTTAGSTADEQQEKVTDCPALVETGRGLSPEIRFFTLEDIYGPSGNSFQAAIGIMNLEATVGFPGGPTAGFGAAIDDMVVQWKEFDLQQDTTECDPTRGGGSCASVEIGQTRVFEGSTILDITILEQTPYDSNQPEDLNDCDLDGTYDGTDDCNDNGMPDIVARAITESLDEEIIILDEHSPGVYTGTLATSASYDVDGVLFLVANGASEASVRIQYFDRDDGTGNVCPNDTDPEAEGTIETSTVVFLVRGEIFVRGARVASLPGMGDGDSYADTNETLEMYLTVSNKTGGPLDSVVARITTDDSKIDCILKPFVRIGDLSADQEKESPEAFVFKVAADAERSGLYEDFTASFVVTMWARQFDALHRTQTVTLPLDLDVTDPGGSPTTFSEGFENPGIEGSLLTEMPLDEGLASLELSDGYRCQYNDPDGPNPWGGGGGEDCFLGFTNATNNAYDWHIHTTSEPDGGRAFLGNHSLHWGVHDTVDPADDTLRFKQLDAIRTDVPINLGLEGPAPELIFAHQVRFYWRHWGQGGVTLMADRAVVHIRFADESGNPVGDWIKIAPYQNPYESQGTDIWTNCKFDPVDDGNDEDDYFDPTDPNRMYGPSSTCFPEFVFGFQGDTDYRNTYDPAAIGRAADGPGLQGSIDRGTWIETRFSLAPFAGRRVFVRFLTTSLEVGSTVTYDDTNIGGVNQVLDDGWYIDEVEVTNTLTTPAVLGIDTKDNSALPPCGPNCSVVLPALAADPASLSAPGQVTVLSAQASFADQCTDGTLQFQFWVDGDNNGVLGDPADMMLRSWTDNPLYIAAPATTTPYGVNVRCSSAPTTCLGAAVNTVAVDCPSHVAFKGSDDPMLESVYFGADKQTLSWGSTQFVDAIRGDLDALRSTGTFVGAVEACLLDDVATNQVTDAEPPLGRDLYYLVRGRTLAQACNQIGGWRTPTDAVDRDGQININLSACP